jgi:sugar phosphate isomerase/epimerase
MFNMKILRRNFLKMSGGAAGALALNSVAGGVLLNACKASANINAAKNFGIQLYTVRDDMAADPQGVLKKLAGYGYKQIESFEGKSGIFWGMGNTGFKKYLDDLGMKIVSAHCDINTDFKRKADEAAAIGMDYLICPYLGPQKTLDDYKKFAARFNECGQIAKAAGIHFAYHNHDYSFIPVDGEVPQDIFMQNTDAGLVDYEMDIYWVVTANQNPQEWLKKYKGRFKACHIKDRMKNAPAGEKNASVVLGTGSIDYPAILKVAKENGMKYYIVEQEKYDGTTPMQSSKANAAFMKQLKLS